MTDSSITNDNVPLASLVCAIQQPFTSLAPAYQKTNLLIRVATTLVIFALLLVICYQPFITIDDSNQQFILMAAAICGLLGVLVTIYGYFADKNKCYNVRELDISFKSGLIFSKIVTQPFLRLQHIELKRGPIERKVGLATIQVFSAGGVQHTFSLPGLTLEQAANLRQFILEHKDVTLHE